MHLSQVWARKLRNVGMMHLETRCLTRGAATRESDGAGLPGGEAMHEPSCLAGEKRGRAPVTIPRDRAWVNSMYRWPTPEDDTGLVATGVKRRARCGSTLRDSGSQVWRGKVHRQAGCGPVHASAWILHRIRASLSASCVGQPSCPEFRRVHGPLCLLFPRKAGHRAPRTDSTSAMATG